MVSDSQITLQLLGRTIIIPPLISLHYVGKIKKITVGTVIILSGRCSQISGSLYQSPYALGA